MDCHHIAGADNYFTPVLSNADLTQSGGQENSNALLNLPNLGIPDVRLVVT